MIFLIIVVFSIFSKGQEIKLSNKVIIKSFNLHSYNIENEWNYINNLFNDKIVQQLQLQGITIAEQGLLKLLQHKLQYIKVLNLTNCIVNPTVIRKLFQQKFIQQLDTLILDGCNLQCQDFKILQQKTLKLKKLSLKKNFISTQGFKYLSSIKMKLNSLNIFGNSLVNTQSVDYLIKFDLTQLIELNVGKTSIKQQNLLKLLSQTNTKNIKYLTINQNTYSAQFYKQFTKLSFDNLEILDLHNLAIDQDGFKYFVDFYLPSLKEIKLSQNQLTSQYGVRIINKNIMPNLQRLNLNCNFIDSKLIQHLKLQNYLFRQLTINIFKIDQSALVQLSHMNLSLLQKLEYSNFHANPTIVQQFFKITNLSNLNYLKMAKIYNVGNVLTYILQKSLNNLQYLQIGDIGEIQSDLFVNKSNIFPKLKRVKLNYYGKNTTAIKKLIQNIQNIAYNVEQLQLVLFFHKQILKQIITNSINYKVQKQLKLTLLKQTTKVYQVQNIPIIQLLITPTIQKHKIILLNLNIIISWIKSDSRSMFQSKRGIQTFIKIDQFIKSYDFTEIKQIIGLQDSLLVFKLMIAENKGICKFNNIHKFQITLKKIDELEMLNNCTFPNIQQLSITNKLQLQIKIQMQYHQTIKKLTLSSFSPQNIIKIFNRYQFNYLQSLDLAGNLNNQHMNQITNILSYFSRIRALNLQNTLINKNLSFLLKNKNRFTNLDLSNILFSQQAISDLANLNLQFLHTFNLQSTGLDDKKIVNFINNLSKNSQQIFSKLRQLTLSNNYITSQGISSIMKLDLPLIQLIYFDNNKDPEIFNSIFMYPSSKRLKIFNLRQSYLSSFDFNIQPKNTRKLQVFYLQSNSIRNIDIQALLNFQFDSLEIFHVNIQKIDYCNTLQHISKIAVNVRNFGIILSKSYGINSKCFQDLNGTAIPENIIIGIQYPYGQVRKFADFFINPEQKFRSLTLVNSYVSQQKILQIATKSHLQNTQILRLSFNNLTQYSIKSILSKQYSALNVLDLSGNQQLSGQALSEMKNKYYQKLLIINLSKTKIGDRGLSFLIQNQFPQLLYLVLINIDLTQQGLVYLSKIKAPKLLQLDISCNGLTALDLLAFNSVSFTNLKLIKFYPSMTNQQKNLITIHLNRFRFKKSTLVQLSTTIVDKDSSYMKQLDDQL